MDRETVNQLFHAISQWWTNAQYTYDQKELLQKELQRLPAIPVDDLVTRLRKVCRRPPAPTAIVNLAEELASETSTVRFDPLMAWEKIREEWFWRIVELTGSRDISEKELFPLTEKDFKLRHHHATIPASAYAGVNETTRCRDPRWRTVESFNRWVQSGAYKNESRPERPGHDRNGTSPTLDVIRPA